MWRIYYTPHYSSWLKCNDKISLDRPKTVESIEWPMQIAQLISSLNCKYDLIIPAAFEQTKRRWISRDWSSQHFIRDPYRISMRDTFPWILGMSVPPRYVASNRPWIASKPTSRTRRRKRDKTLYWIFRTNGYDALFVSKIASCREFA